MYVCIMHVDAPTVDAPTVDAPTADAPIIENTLFEEKNNQVDEKQISICFLPKTPERISTMIFWIIMV